MMRLHKGSGGKGSSGADGSGGSGGSAGAVDVVCALPAVGGAAASAAGNGHGAPTTNGEANRNSANTSAAQSGVLAKDQTNENQPPPPPKSILKSIVKLSEGIQKKDLENAAGKRQHGGRHKNTAERR